MKDFKKKLVENNRKHEVFEELLDSCFIKHYGGFADIENHIVFVRVHNCHIDTDELLEVMGIKPSLWTIGLIGKLANDTDSFIMRGSGWLYFPYKKILEKL